MRSILKLTIILTLALSGYVNGSVILSGTRIIYTEGAKDKTIKLTNPESQPYIVQVHVDNGVQDGHAPFIITPPVFRLEPHSGQSIRLAFTGESLPPDRESVFYFSFSQLPALKANTFQKNKLILAITNRVKIFYRPVTLSTPPGKTADNINFSTEGRQIRIYNNSEYHASIRRASLVRNGKEVRIAEGVMISPKSSMIFTPSSTIEDLKGTLARLVLVNDYGVDIISEHRL